ncbi:hypothetical protein [Mycobacterium sp.]|uniref:hypothetical protein n=1 Tax=Mycobacterium sp. TaxID=1785 RepID=UPI0031D1BFC0
MRAQTWDPTVNLFRLSFDVDPDARRAVAEIAAFAGHATSIDHRESATRDAFLE